MKAFRKDGVYLNLSDSSKEGYFTSDSHGKLKKHNYGLLDKLYDIYRYGKTKEISYNYILLDSRYSESENHVTLYIGSMNGEFTEIMQHFSKASYMPLHKNDFAIISENKLKYLDSKNRECYLSCLREGEIIKMKFINFYDNTPESRVYQFYKFLAY